MSINKFTISHCSSISSSRTPTVDHHSNVVDSRTPASPTTRKNSPRTTHVIDLIRQRRIATVSSDSITAENQLKRAQFVSAAHQQTRMVTCSRKDQIIAVQMLVAETRRYQLSAYGKAEVRLPKHRQTAATPSPPTSFPILIKEVSGLMRSPMWDEPAGPRVPAHERDPYTFTISEINKLGLFRLV